jgi:hypothetical protein
MTNRTIKFGYHTSITGDEQTIATLAAALCQCTEVETTTIYEKNGELDSDGDPRTKSVTLATLKPLAFEVIVTPPATESKELADKIKADIETRNTMHDTALREVNPFTFGKPGAPIASKFFATREAAEAAMAKYWQTKPDWIVVDLSTVSEDA